MNAIRVLMFLCALFCISLQGATLLENDPKAEETLLALPPNSPEAHHDLGILYLKQKQLGKSNYHFLRSVQLESKPWVELSTTEYLTKNQRDLGIRNSATNRWFFWIHLFNFQWMLALFLIVGVWGVIAALSARVFQGPRAQRAAITIGAVPVFALTLVLMILFTTIPKNSVGVLEDSAGPVSIYQGTKEASLEILSLPPGTIVELGKKKPSYRQIVSPIVGWVKTEKLLELP